MATFHDSLNCVCVFVCVDACMRACIHVCETGIAKTNYNDTISEIYFNLVVGIDKNIAYTVYLGINTKRWHPHFTYLQNTPYYKLYVRIEKID